MKPREFWVRPQCDSRFLDSGFCGEVLPNANQHQNQEEIVIKGYFKVVLKSAYDALKAELERTEAQNQRLRAESKLNALNECRKELAALREENDRLSVANTFINEQTDAFIKMRKERDKLQAQLKIARVALEKYKGVKVWIATPTNYGQDLRHSEQLVADDALAEMGKGEE